MTVWQQVIALVFTPTAIVAVLAFLLRGFFQQLLDKDAKRYEAELEKSLKSYEAQLTKEYEISKLRLENELQKQFYQYQTKFSIYHQKQVEVVSELYGMIVETRDKVESLVAPVKQSDGRTDEERYNDTLIAFNSFSTFYRKNRIYINESSCQKVDTILKIMRISIFQNKTFQGLPNRNNQLLDAWKAIREEAIPLQSELEKQLRQSLSEITEIQNAPLD